MGSLRTQIGQTGGNTPRSRPKPYTAGDYMAFLIPCLEFVRIRTVGVMNGTDIALILLFIYFVFTRKVKVPSPLAKRFLVLGFLWLGSQCATDVVRHSAFADYARGWSNIALTLLNFTTMCTLIYGRPRRLLLYGWGLVLAASLQFAFGLDEGALFYPWKFGFSFPVTLAVVLLACRKECSPTLRVGMLSGIGAVNLLLGARNAGGICLAVAIYLLATGYIRERTARGKRISGTLKVLTATVLVLGVAGVFSFYQYAASKGYLGQDSQEKYEEESSGKYGVLLGGRVELLSSIPAIVDSPILGHGSWAKDPGYLIAGREALAVLGYRGTLDISPDDLVDGLIPTHSFFFGAWVFGGICGAIFWAWVWITVVRSLTRVYPQAALLLPLMVYFSFLLSWDILFSPFSLDRRNQVPYYLVMIMTYYEMRAPQILRSKIMQARRALKPALNTGD
jgi:hypothetical protein